MTRSGRMLFGVGLLALGGCGPRGMTPPGERSGSVRPSAGVQVTPAIPPARVVAGQTLLVPIYSNIATADNATAINLAVTLTVRNLDLAGPIVVQAIKYYDSGGRLVRSYLDDPIRIGPLASIDLFVRESDNSGGSSPSFLVDWVAEQDVTPAQADAVMISTAGTLGITLTSSGRVVATYRR